MKRGSGALPKIKRRLTGGSLTDSQLLGMLRGTRKVRLFVSELRPNLGAEQLGPIAKKLAQHALFGSQALGTQFPRNVSQINQRIPFGSIGLSNEVIWAAARLETCAAKISRFLQIREQLSSDVLRGDHPAVLDRVSGLEQEIGYSIFSIQNRLLALQNAKGRGAQKAFLRSVYDTEGVSGYVYFITYHLSLAAERGGSIEKVNAALRSFKKNTNSSVHAFFRMRLSSSLELSDEELDDALREASTFSAVDLYEAFVQVLQILVASNRIQSLSSVALGSVWRLAKQIPDFRFDAIRLLQAQETSSDAVSSRYLAIMGQYVSGDSSASSEAAKAEVASRPELAIYLPLIADCLCSVSELPNLSRTLVNCMRAILHCATTAQVAAKDLQRLAFVHSGFPWSKSIAAFLHETGTYPRSAQHDAHWVLGALNMPFQVPELMVGCLAPPEIAHRRLSAAADSGARPALAYLNLQSCPDSEPIPTIGLDQMDPAIRYVFLSKRALRNGKLNEALDQEFGDSTLGLGRNLEALSLHTMLLGRSQELELALGCLVQTYLELPESAVRFDVRKIIEDIDRRPSPVRLDNLDRPIGFDIFSRTIDSSKDRRLAFAYNQFLRAVGVSKPSDLKPILGRFEKSKLLYFLRWICVPSIMDQFPAIEGTRALDQERIAVCQIVAELEPTLEAECFDEIKALTRKLVIYDGLKRVEQSKIYVDAESIQRSLEKRLAEQFARFSALVNSAQVFNEIAQIQERKLANQRGEPTESMSISLPTEDPASLFTSLAADIWREFLTGSEFSLDVYLSVRIRHGTLAGQLRSPLEALHLVTQHDGQRYNPNTYWTSGWPVPEFADRLNAAFSEFSERVDDYIRMLTTSVLRIRLNKDEEGMFDFRLSVNDINHMLARFDPSGSLSDLIKVVFDTLWNILSQTLPSLQAFFFLKVSSWFASHLECLRENVASLGIEVFCPSLAPTIIEAEAVMQRTCVRVANWFRLSKTSSSVDFALDLAISIAAESVRNCFGANAVREHIAGSDAPMLDGKYLLPFVDMFIILFENARRHSRISACPVDVQVQLAGSLLTISVSNPLAANVDRQRLVDRLETMRSSFENDLSAQAVAREGGSGFHKLRKILAGDLNCLHAFDFAIRNDQFAVDIVLEMVA